VPASPARPIPFNLFGIGFGLLGLGDCWLVAADFGLVPVGLGRALAALAIVAWAVVLVAHVRAMRTRRVGLGTELADPVLGPFASLAVLTPMSAAAGALYPYSHGAATVIVDVGVVVTVILAGWLVGQWIYRPLDLAKIHPGYFLPSVAGGFVAAAALAQVGQHGLAVTLFGLGAVSWLVIGSIVLGRLIAGPPLPPPLIPTIAIEVAPAGVATFAAFAINGDRIDLTVKLLAAYGLLMVVAQLRLAPAYLRLSFMPSFWSFTFAWAAVAFAGECWLGIARPAGWRIETYVVLALITALIGAIAVRTAIALRRGALLPAPSAPTTAPTTAAAALPVAHTLSPEQPTGA
jgi:tellurite resistance protein